ncbi:L,L-diaminopimelate aminotransferase [Fischerella sp. NIES-4106]|nr:L,L-diaminopimelate aminotransferase [Fischerella sp. NIES-4106]
MAGKNSKLSQFKERETYTQFVQKQVWRKVEAYQAEYPQHKFFLMAFGNTTQPLTPTVEKALIDSAHRLSNPKTYTGYEDIIGNPNLRQAICTDYYGEKLGVEIDLEDVFISDGAQSTSVNIQELFAENSKVAIPNPVYPSFIEGTLLAGRPLIYLPCDETNNFVPNPPKENVDLIYLCFPNNPTGTVPQFTQLEALVNYAREHKSVIIYDAVYSLFITTSSIPKSIYEIEGAKECAIEIGSFSKWANFTGLRVGWAVIPQELTICNTVPGELNALWRIRHEIKFWGTANIAQMGALAALSRIGQLECQEVVNYYLQNARMLRNALEAVGIKCFGAIDSPFVWVKSPRNWDSWQFFDYMMRSTGIVGVPGSVFGDLGEGYLRLSGLGHRESIEGAVSSLSQLTRIV